MLLEVACVPPVERLHAGRKLLIMAVFRPRTYTRKRFPAFLYCLLLSSESRTTSSLLEIIQKRRKTFPCVRDLKGLFFGLVFGRDYFQEGL